MTSRRAFLYQSTVTAAGLLLPAAKVVRRPRLTWPAGTPRGFIDLRRPPDSIVAQTVGGDRRLKSAADGRWQDGDVSVTLRDAKDAVRVELSAPQTPLLRLNLRWRATLFNVRLIMGDAWERGYGDLEWRSFVPDRVMPWYFAAWDGRLTHLYGVRTGAKAFCYWNVDPRGISLWADVRSGGVGVRLGERMLHVCDVVCRAGRERESAFAAVHAFCRQMCQNPRLPAQPVFGSNDWYWVYGKNSATTVLADAQHVVELSPPESNRPFAVIDDGWQPVRGEAKTGVGAWDRGNEKFPDIPKLVDNIRRTGARPGIWIRPLQSPADTPDSWRLPRDRNFLDPTVTEVREKVAADIARLRAWGFELIKHDYTTYDLFGRWGFQMGSALTRDGWTFATGPTRTTAEVVDELYSTIRQAAGEALIIGCNTVSHLSAGHFEICRIGDDTSGTEWARTRKMGVNSLAFRGAQTGAFYVADALATQECRASL
jgi:alpha-galactosidase